MSRHDSTTEEYFKHRYRFDPYYLFSRDVHFEEIRTDNSRSLIDRLKLLEELEYYFATNEEFEKAKDVNDFKLKWKEELKQEFVPHQKQETNE